MKNIFKHLLDLFFPHICVVCETSLMGSEKFVCLNCLSLLPKTNYYKQADNPVEQLLAGRIPFVRIASYMFFVKGGSLQHIIHELKYKNNPGIGVWLGKMSAKDLQGTLFLKNIDYIVPVPLHTKRLRKRGYNQSLMIAKGLSAGTGIPIRDDVVFRIVNNKSQTSKSKTERYDNISGVFAMNNLSDFENKHILLIDDLITTGATLEECAKTILLSSNAKISIFTIGSTI